MSNGLRPLPDLPGPRKIPKEVYDILTHLRESDIWGKILLADATGMIAEVGWTYTLATTPEPKEFIVRAIRFPDDVKQDVTVRLTRAQPSTTLPFDFSDAPNPPATAYVLVVDLHHVNQDWNTGNNTIVAEAYPYTHVFDVFPGHAMAHAGA